MRNSIAHAFVACLCTFLAVVLPATGRHRRTPDRGRPGPAVTEAVPAPPAAPPTSAAAPCPRSPYAAYNADPDPLTGEQVRLVRPYLLVHERAVRALVERAEHEQAARERRLAAALVTLGVDVGPGVHGVRLPA